MNDVTLVKSAARALKVLELLATGRTSMSLTDIGGVLDIPMSSMHALMRTLHVLGYVVRDLDTGSYRIGWRVSKLARSFGDTADLIELASPIIQEMGSSCSETIMMSRLDGTEIAFIHVRPASSLVQVVNQVGARLPAHATASGKMMLAHLTEVALDDIYPTESLPDSAGSGIRRKTRLREELRLARERGWALDEGESEPGVWAVASCILDAGGSPVGAICIEAPFSRVDPACVPQWTGLVTSACRKISTMLGYNDAEMAAERGNMS